VRAGYHYIIYYRILSVHARSSLSKCQPRFPRFSTRFRCRNSSDVGFPGDTNNSPRANRSLASTVHRSLHFPTLSVPLLRSGLTVPRSPLSPRDRRAAADVPRDFFIAARARPLPRAALENPPVLLLWGKRRGGGLPAESIIADVFANCQAIFSSLICRPLIHHASRAKRHEENRAWRIGDGARPGRTCFHSTAEIIR